MTLINARQLDTSPIPYVVDGLFPLVGSGIGHGPSSAGKSYALVTRLACDVANGAPYFGHETQQGVVIMCLGEGLQDAGIRIKAQLAQHAEENAVRVQEVLDAEGPEAAEKFAASLSPYTDDLIVIETEPFAMPTDAKGKPSSDMQRFIASVAGLNPVLVIYDAVADFSGGSSLINETTANRYVAGIKHLVSELDCFILGIAHDTADGEKMLGNLRFFNASDTFMAIKPDQGADNVSTITCEKQKGGPKFAPFSYQALPRVWDEPVLDDHGHPTGEIETVSTNVVVQAKDSGSGDGFTIPAMGQSFGPLDLPAMRSPGPVRRKRTGVRAPVPTTVEKREAYVASRLSGPCDECGAPPTRGCNPLPGSHYTTIAPGIDIHDSRDIKEPA